MYGILYETYGNLGWWPGENAEEVAIGAVLTQNTSWSNVERSLKGLKENRLGSLEALSGTPLERITGSIRSSGTYRRKAAYLKGLSVAIIEKYETLDSMKYGGTGEIGEFLLSLKGVGNETAESIMLYALDFPVPVVDAYTFRILGRVNRDFESSREELKDAMLKDLGSSVSALKNYHAMLVQLAKDHCRKKPLCGDCPLKTECSYYIDLSSP